jgi:hypothetical protein
MLFVEIKKGSNFGWTLEKDFLSILKLLPHHWRKDLLISLNVNEIDTALKVN